MGGIGIERRSGSRSRRRRESPPERIVEAFEIVSPAPRIALVEDDLDDDRRPKILRERYDLRRLIHSRNLPRRAVRVDRRSSRLDYRGTVLPDRGANLFPRREMGV
jgi:hypothetical protein